jgi:hypothetical protein
MKLRALVSLSMVLIVAWSLSAIAGDDSGTVLEKKVVVALKTDDVELHEVDVSHLQPGDSETVYTESGKTVDILRTQDDVEIYIDGELVDGGKHAKGSQEDRVHVVRKRIEINCDDRDDCDEMEWISEDGNVMILDEDGLGEDGEVLHEDKKVYIIKKEVVSD